MNDFINNTRLPGTSGDPSLSSYQAGEVENAGKTLAVQHPNLVVGDRAYEEKLLSLLAATTPQKYLEQPRTSPSSQSAGNALEATESYDFYQVSMALFEVAKSLRHANREMRHAERDSAMAENMNAAEKIRSAALMSLIFASVSTAISIGASVFSATRSVNSAYSTGKAISDVKGPNLEMRQLQTQNDLAKSQIQLKQAKVDAGAVRQDLEAANVKVNAAQEKIAASENALRNAEAHKNVLAGNPDSRPAAIRSADADVQAQNNALAQARAAKVQAEAERAPIAEKLNTANAKVENLEADVQSKAVVAGKANRESQTYLENKHHENAQKIAGLDEKIVNAAPDSPRLAELRTRVADLRNENVVLQNKINGCVTTGEQIQNPLAPAALDDAARVHLTISERISPSGDVGQAYQNVQNHYNAAMGDANQVFSQNQILQTGVQGLSQMAQGAGEFAASRERAEGQEATARAQKHQAGEQESTDFQNSFNDLVRQVQDTLRKWQECMTQANSQIIRNI